MRNFTFLLFSVLILHGCDHFEYSPNQESDRDSPRNINERSLERLKSASIDDTIVIALTGDSQRFYDNVDRFVSRVNEIPEVDFILLNGDISDFGMLKEYEWVHRSFSKLNKPYFGVVGNHDVVSNGENVFLNMYGPLDFSFVYDSVKFILHNTNGREYSDRRIPDMEWLSGQLMKNEDEHVHYFVTVAHVPPFDGDFRQDLVVPYTELLSSKPDLLLSLNAHIHDHTDGFPFNDGVRYLTAFAFDSREFVIVKICGKSVSKSIVKY